MKTLLITCICSIALAIGAWAQSPDASAAASVAGPSTGASASVSPAVSPTASSDLADKIHRRIDQKLKHKGMHFTIGDQDGDTAKESGSHNDVPEAVIPLVAIVFMTIFGAPVLIVAVIMYFGFSRNRMMHKTVRMMVEKGQPVPAALLNPPPHVRKRSDMRRGVVLVMVGLGLMVFLAAVNEWEGGAWSLGIIPFLIGAGYLLVWKLEGKGTDGLEGKADNPPPVP
jgi:Domain of unknown function (DUF6249)